MLSSYLNNYMYDTNGISLTVNTYVNIFNDYNEYRLSKNYSLNDIVYQLGG